MESPLPVQISFHIKWHHGGKLKEDGMLEKYVGGIEEVEKNVDADKISRLDLLWKIREAFKYQFCGPLYYQPRGTGDFVEIVNDGVVMDMLKGINNENIVDVYVDYVSGTHQADVACNSTTLESVANMVIYGQSDSFNTNLSIIEEDIPIEGNRNEENTCYANIDEGNESAHHSDNDNDDKSDSDTLEDELNGADLDGAEGTDNDEEVEQIKQTVSSYRRERSKRNRGIQQNEIELRVVGNDIGF
ncbi:uncharacterized protein [Euphorbia lathyris]|uniref:uncharacterized protein isoform X2 n=1 Tax=Euphorbia lathyris TaxID=212925 RepID=UPI0033137BF5